MDRGNLKNVGKRGVLASITLNIRAVMYEAGALQQVELESEVLRRLGLYEDTAKHATVKRRIYDALSTFIALEIIQKVNKMLYWNGFPHYGPKPDLPGSGSAEVQSKLDSSAIVTEDSSRTLNSETNEHDPVAAGMDAIVPTAAEEGDDNASVEELEAQIAELEGRISVLSQQHAYYTFFNSQALLSPQWDQGSASAPPVALPFTVIAVPSEADAVIFSNQNHTRISIDASMQNITILSDDQIVQALIQNTDKA